jgi:hypothetical protein
VSGVRVPPPPCSQAGRAAWPFTLDPLARRDPPPPSPPGLIIGYGDIEAASTGHNVRE